jgi:hypothetical protein
MHTRLVLNVHATHPRQQVHGAVEWAACCPHTLLLPLCRLAMQHTLEGSGRSKPRSGTLECDEHGSHTAEAAYAHDIDGVSLHAVCTSSV